MRLIENSAADDLRSKFIAAFIDTGTEYYKEHVEELIQFSDGLCYIGYLWDCLAWPIVITEKEAYAELEKHEGPLYVMWDNNSCDRIFIPDYWKYPKKAIAELTLEEYNALKDTFPEDHYIFNDDFDWMVALTHEDVDSKRWCLLSKKR